MQPQYLITGVQFSEERDFMGKVTPSLHKKGGHHAQPFKAMRFDQGMASRKQEFMGRDILSRYFACGFRCRHVLLRKAFRATLPFCSHPLYATVRVIYHGGGMIDCR